MDIKIKWIDRKDINDIVNIENISSNSPWSKKDLITFFRQSTSIGYVATLNEKVVGYILYQSRSKKIKILNVTVDPNCRRKKIGSSLVSYLISKLGLSKNKLEICVPEENLGMHLFLKSNKFKAVCIESDNESNYYKFNYCKSKVLEEASV